MNNDEIKKLGISGKIAKIFVTNGKLSLLLAIFLTVWGILSFAITPKQYNPDIVAPAFQVITYFPGATVEEVQELISKPMEDAAMDIDGVDEIMSQSLDGGTSIVTVKFFVGENMEESKINLQQKFNSHFLKKPLNASNPVIKTIDPDNVPIITIAIESQKRDEAELRYFSLKLRDQLKVVQNTSNIDIIGGRKNQLSIWLNADRMTAYKLSPLDIQNAISASNIRILSEGIKTGSGYIPLEIDGNINTVDELKNIVVMTTESHRIYLKDIATVKEEHEEIKHYTALQNKNEDQRSVVFISIAKKKGTNIIQVANAVTKKIENLQTDNQIPDDIELKILRNEGITAWNEIKGLVINLILAILIVAFVLLLFLESRPAFIVAIVIPLTLGVVFGVGLLAGKTINRITLFALILSLGLLVDNATVVVENILRNFKNTKDKKLDEITIQSVDEVGMGLFMSTVTTVFAFIPMAFVTGMMGPYMGPIPFFVPTALIASLFIAFTINPWLSSIMLKHDEDKLSSVKIIRKIKDIGKNLMKYYRQTLNFLLQHSIARNIVLLVIIMSFGIVMLFPVFQLVKFRMLPKADREQFYIYLDLPEKATIDDTKNVSDYLSDILSKELEISSIQSFIGIPPVIDFNGLFKGAEGRNNEYQATLKVNLLPTNKRDLSSESIVLRLRTLVKDKLMIFPDVRFTLVEDPPGPPVMATMLAKIQGEDINTLKKIAKDVEQLFRNIDDVEDVDSTISFPITRYKLKIDQEKAAHSGLTTAQIAQAMNIYMEGVIVGIYHTKYPLEEEYIVMRLKNDDRDDIIDISKINLKNKLGEMVSLSSIVDSNFLQNEDILYRDEQKNTVYVFAEMGNRGVTYAVIDAMKELWNYKLPSGYGERTAFSLFGMKYFDKQTNDTYEINWGGEWKLTLEVFRDLGLAMIVAIFLIYFVLVAQFRSFIIPLIAMGTIPLAMIGVMPGFYLLGVIKGLYFNATSMIGVIALAGIVVNNAIILLEYLNSLKRKGYTIKPALIEAGSTRLRPILLTTATTILGSLTIVSDPVWAGLAWSIIFGLSISSILTLIIFPILYYTFQKNEWNEG